MRFFASAASLVLLSFLEEGEGRGNSRGSSSARAALNFRSAIRIFTNKFALGFRAVGFMTFPVALGFLADSLALRFRSLAVSYAMRLLANCDTFRAVEHFAAFIRAFDFTFRLFTFYIANGIFRLSAGRVAFRRLTYGITDCRTVRIVTLPGALRVTLSISFSSKSNIC
jgi:hypothetical protein